MMDGMVAQCQPKIHYDFGLRFQLAVIRGGGRLLSLDPTLDENELLVRKRLSAPFCI
jgi:hypothetical protein